MASLVNTLVADACPARCLRSSSDSPSRSCCATPLPGMSVARALLIMPTTIAPIVVGFLFRYMYDPTGGLIPWLLTAAGVPIPQGGPARLRRYGAVEHPLRRHLAVDAVLRDRALRRPACRCRSTSIEAARLDGASAWTMLRRIRLPLIRKTRCLVVMLRFMQLFNTFDLVLVLTARRSGLVHAHPRLHALSTGTRRLQHRPRQRHDLDHRHHRQRAYRALRLLRLQGLGVGRCARASISCGRA